MTSAEVLFEEIRAEGYERLARFVKEQQEEHLHLDFKEKSDRKKGAAGHDDQKSYSEALSGFANSDGV